MIVKFYLSAYRDRSRRSFHAGGRKSIFAEFEHLIKKKPENSAGKSIDVEGLQGRFKRLTRR